MTAEDVIRTHTEGFNRALTTHDLDALSAIYADDYMLVRPDGARYDENAFQNSRTFRNLPWS